MRARPNCLSSDPTVLERYAKDMVYRGHADYAYTAGDTKTLSEIIAWCHATKTPLTFCGSQTSMTGSSAPDGGVIAALGAQNKIHDIGIDPTTKVPFVICDPGVILGDLKRAVSSQGYLYPPDPTSFEEATIGATVATNATGEETFRFGPTRHYVDELELLGADGKIRTLKRSQPLTTNAVKNTAGYFLDGEAIDQIIGSEGTLALITKLRLRLIKSRCKNVFALVLPFSKFENCLRAVPRIAAVPERPRALELIGPGAGAYFKLCPACPDALKSEEIFLYIKDDYEDDLELARKIGRWHELLKDLYTEFGEEYAFERLHIAQSESQLADIRACRHFIPLKVNEDYFPYIAQGGGKIGTDWWVPLNHLTAMMVATYNEALELGVPFLVFAHIGNGHPHWNFLTRTADEYAKAKAFVERQCRKAVLLGGGVAGEHGIGKIKRDLLAMQHAPNVIERMIALKRQWDPDWILGRGNILAPPQQE